MPDDGQEAYLQTLAAVLGLAVRWGRCRLTDDMAAALTGWHFDHDLPTGTPGVIVIRDEQLRPGIYLDGCTLTSCTLNVTDTISDLINDQLERDDLLND
jgi:hypothetical protein